jgi:O-acetyl-ADP-ribose deacetylase
VVEQGTTRVHVVGGTRIEVVVGDLVDQPDLDAIVNAANPQLAPGGGVAGAVHRAAGPGLAAECRPLAPIATGTCVLTGGHDLPNPHVVHCVGPVYDRDEHAAELLTACYRQAIALADQAELTSIGFPAISTGIFGYPVAEAAEVALTAIAAVAGAGLRSVRLIRLVLFDEATWQGHVAVLDRLQPSG